MHTYQAHHGALFTIAMHEIITCSHWVASAHLVQQVDELCVLLFVLSAVVCAYVLHTMDKYYFGNSAQYGFKSVY